MKKAHSCSTRPYQYIARTYSVQCLSASAPRIASAAVVLPPRLGGLKQISTQARLRSRSGRYVVETLASGQKEQVYLRSVIHLKSGEVVVRRVEGNGRSCNRPRVHRSIATNLHSRRSC